MGKWSSKGTKTYLARKTNGKLTSFYEEVRDRIQKNHVKNLLSIGGGTGELEIELMLEFPNLNLTFLEPNSELFQTAKTDLDEFKSRTKFVETTFQQYEIDEPFDLIFAGHSWYYIEPNPKMIHKAIGLLNQSGQLFIGLKDRHSYTIDLFQKVRGFDSETFTADDFELILNNEKIKHNRIKKAFRTSSTRYFEKDDINPKALTWVAWMTDLEVDSLSADQKQLAYKALKTWEVDGEILSHESLFAITKD